MLKRLVAGVALGIGGWLAFEATKLIVGAVILAPFLIGGNK